MKRSYFNEGSPKFTNKPLKRLYLSYVLVTHDLSRGLIDTKTILNRFNGLLDFNELVTSDTWRETCYFFLK